MKPGKSNHRRKSAKAQVREIEEKRLMFYTQRVLAFTAIQRTTKYS